MKKKVTLFSTSILTVTITAIFLFCNLGDTPIGHDYITTDDTVSVDDTVVWEEGSMELNVDPSDLRASYNSTAMVTVRIYNTNHNPVSGKTVYFKATHGVIGAQATTDANGTAEVTFTSEPINVEAAIYAWIHDSQGNVVMVGHSVTISGVVVGIIATPTHALIPSSVQIKIHVTDADGNAISTRPVILTGGIVDTIFTKGDGFVDTSITQAYQGSVVINAESQGAFASATVYFWEGSIPDTVTDTTGGTRTLRIFSSKSQLNADNTDYATITAILINDNNNPAVGDTVKFSIAKPAIGIIGEYGIVDSSGRTSVTLQSAPENGICKLYGETTDKALKDSTTVLFSGVSLQLTADPVNLNINEQSILQALLSDASSKPIGGKSVLFSTDVGIFDNGLTSISIVTNTGGIAQTTITAASASNVYIHASGSNCSDSAIITFTNNRLTLSANPTVISVGGLAYSTLTATYIDGSNNPIPSQWIHFYTNAGTLSSDSVLTNSSGQAGTRLYSAYFAGEATVQAVAPNGTAEATVEFAAIEAANIELKVSPDNIGVNGGVATLTATVTDTNNNMVTGAEVNFKILKGPGGDEYIDKPVVTSKDGIARSQIYAGSIPSMYRACEVAASVGIIADTSKMTISGEPYIVTVARPQDDTVVVTEVGQINPSTFTFNAGAVIQDVNGNNVADGMEVHFSAVISGLAVARKRFVRWEVSATEIRPIITYDVIQVPFEDINNNLQMDQNIDLDLDDYPLIASRGDDVNGNGIMAYDYRTHDLFFDFNFNGICDFGKSEPHYDITYITQTVGYDTVIAGPFVDTSIVPYWNPDSTEILWDTTITLYYDTTITPITEIVDSTCIFFADLNNNGEWDKTELWRDHNGNQICDTSAEGDFQWWRWEMRPQFHGIRFDFHTNDFAVVIASSAVTKDGVAEAGITYPRQMANRLIVSINAEINGIRDKDGERFALPVLIQGE